MISYGVLKAEIDLLGLVNMRDDYNAALTLEDVLSNLRDVKRLSEILRDLCSNSCIVLMPGRGIERLDKYVLQSHDIVIVCDSAVDYLSRSDILSELRDRTILVTDLDAEWDSLMKFCRAVRPIVIVHAHGDNMGRIPWIRYLEYSYICGTCQVPLDLRLVEYVEGFTDGDRALILASKISRKIEIIGLDYSSTYSSKGISTIKRVKFNILSYYVDTLRSSTMIFIY
ncbi:MAG: hypothetical protein GXO10_03355 [Crenarchaeota archaeon]|nr:hypothetical protein [Thermoproteota archaeon]